MEAFACNNETSGKKLANCSPYFTTLQYTVLFFSSLRAGGSLQILQSDWLRERAVFYDLAR